MGLFFDTSALTKRYVEEVGSEQVRILCAQADALGVSVLVVPELISTLCRLVREGRLSSESYQSLKTALLADLCDLTQDTFEQTSVASNVIRCGRWTPFTLGALSLPAELFRLCRSAPRPGLRPLRRPPRAS